MKTLAALLCSILFSTTVTAETFSITYEKGRVIRRYPDGSQPVIGLALSGGGARGIAQIGVIDALEQAGLRIERIAGSSMGSIVGGLYAAGYSPSSLSDIVNNFDWSDAFKSTPRRRTIYIGRKETSRRPLSELRFEGLRARIPSSLSSGQRILSFLSWLSLRPTYECGRDFDKLPIPFRSVATDLENGSKVTLGYGNLGRALFASSAVPLLFAPVNWNDTLLVDGGLMDNLPIRDVRKMGSDFVIAVAIEESMHPLKDLDNPLNVADQATSILMRNVTQLSKKYADFVISPDMEGFSSTSFSRIPEMIEQGRQSALAALPALMDSLEKKTSTCRKARINTISVSPEENEGSVLTVFSKRIQIGTSVLFADIIKLLESLWSTGSYCAVKANLDENTGHLHIELTNVPESVTVIITGQNKDKSINRKIILSSKDNNNPSMQKVISRVDSLVRSVRMEGYSFTRITNTEINETDNSLIINATVPKITRILIDKNLKSRRSLIMREFEMEPGDTFDLKKVMRSVENLYGTNLYEIVYADVEQYNGGVGLRIHITEKNWSILRFGLRFDETNSSEGHLSLIRENILGFGNQFSLKAQSGKRMKLLMLNTKNDRIYKSLYTFDIKTYNYFRMRPVYRDHKLIYDYEDDRWGAVFSLGQQMDKFGKVLLQFKTETIRTRFPVTAQKRKEKKEIRSFIVRSLIDSYDRYPFPWNGTLNLIYIERASEFFGGSEQFTKIFWGNSFVKTFARKHTVTGSFLVGTADPSIPDIEAFTLGGIVSKLNSYDIDITESNFYGDFMGLSDEEKLGNRLAVSKLSYRLFIPKYFYLDLIYSIGNVWARGATITVDSLLQSYGIRGSFATIVGPISFGWGITSMGEDKLYMSAGWEF